MAPVGSRPLAGRLSLLRFQRGQSMVETSMVLPILFFIIFGIVEGSLLVFSLESANYAAQQGARVLAEAGQSPAADTQALVAIRSTALGQTNLAEVTSIDFENVDSGGNPVAGKGDHYRLDGTAIGSPGWPPASRNVTECCSDYVRVTIHLRYRYRSGLLGSAPGLTATAVARLRPRTLTAGRPLTGPFPTPTPSPSASSLPVPRPSTWTCTGATPVWTHLTTATEPGGRSLSVMAYDSRRRIDVLFGGYRPGPAWGDTWEWDGTAWNLKSPASSPAPRGDAAMAFDPAIGKVVLFGGAPSSVGAYGDTWEWDGVNWSRVSPPAAPPGRAGASLTWNPARGRLVLFGGVAVGGGALSPPLVDTWEFDGRTWTQRVDSGTGPAPDHGMGADYDPVLGSEVVYGGQSETAGGNPPFETWTFGSTADAPGLLVGVWRLAFTAARPHPPATRQMAMAYVPNLGVTVAFGGSNDTGSLTVRPFNETWQLGPAGWTQLHPATSPPPMYQLAAATDPRGGMLVRAFPDTAGQSGTWELTTCRLVPGAPPPPSAPSIPAGPGAGGGGPVGTGATYG